MRTLTEITNQVEGELWYTTYEMLKQWAHELIDICAGSAECVMESDNQGGEYCVLDRKSIIDVKNQIQ